MLLNNRLKKTSLMGHNLISKRLKLISKVAKQMNFKMPNNSNLLRHIIKKMISKASRIIKNREDLLGGQVQSLILVSRLWELQSLITH